jgi:hypothetical protein
MNEIINTDNIAQTSNSNLNVSLPPVSTPVTPPTQVAPAVTSQEKYEFPDHSNEDLKKKLRNEKAKRFLKYIPLVLSLLIAIALGYLYLNTKNALMAQKTTIEKVTSDYNAQKAIVDAKSNCDACPALPVEEAPKPTTTTTKKSTSVSTQETVLAPPAPPAD